MVQKIKWSFAHLIDYDNLTQEQIIEFVETIDWEKVPPNLLFTKETMQFSIDFPQIEDVIENCFIEKCDLLTLIKKLIDSGFDIHWENDSLLRLASGNGCTEIVKLLLEVGADVHADNNMPLIYAVSNGCTEIIKLLLEAGADVHVVSNDYTELVKLFLEVGVDIHAQNEHSIICASQRDHIEMTEIFLKYAKH